jgi:predicted Rossmann-fold nucleotide-binding protein
MGERISQRRETYRSSDNLYRLRRRSLREDAPLVRSYVAQLYNALSDHGLALVAGNNIQDFLCDHRAPRRRGFFDHSPIAELLLEYRDSCAVSVNGTARNEALTEQTSSFLSACARIFVANQICLVTGGASSGAMGAAVRAFKEEIAAQSSEAGATTSQIISVLLKLAGEKASYEAPEDIERFGRCSTKQLSWLNRTPALHGIAQQRVMIFVEGGLGTLYEIFYPMSCREFRDTEIVGVFYNRRHGLKLAFVTPPQERHEHFWSPLFTLVKEMAECGFATAEHCQVLHIDPAGPGAMKEVLALVQAGEGEQKGHADDVYQRQLSHFAGIVAECGQIIGAEPNESNRIFKAFVVNTFVVQRLLQFWRRASKNIATAKKTLACKQLEDMSASLRKDRQVITQTMKRLSSKTVIYCIAPRQRIWNSQLELFSSAIITEAVARNISIVINSPVVGSLSFEWRRMWRAATALYEKQHRTSSDSELVIAPFLGDRDGEELSLGKSHVGETILPEAVTLEARTALAGCLGKRRAVILAPGGPRELCAFSQMLLDSQMAGSVDGCYESPKDRPTLCVLNVPGREGRSPFYSNLREQLDVMIEGKTIGHEEVRSCMFEDLENPEEAAKRLLRELATEKDGPTSASPLEQERWRVGNL